MASKIGPIVIVIGSFIFLTALAAGGSGSGVAAWGAAALIETGNAGDADLPRIALDPNGNAVAVWTQSDGTRESIWSNRFQ